MRSLLLIALATSACGYTVIGADAPFGLHRLTLVPLLEDEPVGLSAELSAALGAALSRGGVQLTTDATSAEGVLRGTILSENTYKSPVANLDATIPAYELQVLVRVELLRAGQVIWTTEVSAGDAFLPGEAGNPNTQTLATEANRRKALARLAERLAALIHERLVIAAAARG